MSQILTAIEALYRHFGKGEIPEALAELFTSNEDFLLQVEKFDEIISANPETQILEEYAFDLLMAHHLEKNQQNEDYFDSKDWQDIEDKTIERGTELLNILLYINESQDADAPISLEDFLYEFLLVDEDEFQDEHRIYEDLISHEEITEENIDTILQIGKAVSERSEIKELFVPLVLFFKNPEAKDIDTKLQPIERGLLACLLAYKNA